MLFGKFCGFDYVLKFGNSENDVASLVELYRKKNKGNRFFLQISHTLAYCNRLMNIIKNFIKLVFGIPNNDPIPPIQFVVFFVLMTIVLILFVTFR